MLFLLFSIAFSVDPYTGHKVNTIPINSAETYTIVDCLVETGNNLAISIVGGPSTLNCRSTTFSNIQRSGDAAVLSNWGAVCNLNFDFVCIADCSASSRGGAFLYQSTSSTTSLDFNYMTIKNCHSNERVIYTVGNRNSDMTYTNCNFSQCSQYTSSTSAAGAFLFCNYTTNLKYSTFEGNDASVYLISYDLSDSGVSITGVTDTCNIVHNTFTTNPLIIITRQHYTIQNSIIKDNSEDVTLFATSNSGTLTLSNCIIQQFKTTGFDVTECVIGSSANQNETYALIFYETHKCLADIPYMTPLNTPFKTYLFRHFNHRLIFRL